MLEHQEPNDAGIPAAQVRVKTEELAHALAAIEARRQEETRRLAETVALGDAVQDLQLDVTPDEILAEVHAQRQQHLQETRPEQNHLPDSWPVFSMVAKILAAIIGAFLVLAWLMSLGTRPVVVTPIVSDTRNAPSAVEETPSDASLLPLSSLPDKTSFGCSFRTVDQLLSDVSASQIMLTEEERDRVYSEGGRAGFDPAVAPDVRSSWTAVKYGQKVYLQGWIAQRLTAAPKPSQTFHIFNSPDVPELGGHPARVTLATGTLNYQGMFMRIDNPLYKPPFDATARHPFYQRLTQEIVVSGVHLDGHAWEKWP